MKIIFLSDTHNYQEEVIVPEGDILVHCGDLTMSGTIKEFSHAVKWFEKQKSKFLEVITIFGNHDFLAEQNPGLVKAMFDSVGVIVLQDSGIEIDGYNFWGSPYTPEFGSWAFMRNRGDAINRHWKMIPENTDILITHGPAHGILDKNEKGQHCGCFDLGERIKIIKPVIHAFGHIHEGYGLENNVNTKYVNCSVLDGNYDLVNKPVMIELPERNNERK